MYIKNIKWIDEENKEALVIVTNDRIELECFSYPLEKNKNDMIDVIHCLSVKDICISMKKEYSIQYNEKNKQYIVCGQLINKEEGVLLFDNVEMDISESYIPADIKEGEFICFKTARLDIW